MTNYKEVFQLAQDKGSGTLNWSTADSNYLKLCLIQKWLRDEHKIDISINPHYKMGGDVAGYIYDISSCLNSQGNGLNKLTGGGDHPIYETSVLLGINEALKLI